MTCTHRDTIRVAQLGEGDKGALVCADCVREGTDWVHLRQCLACGHVGCCDDSPRRHARGHWRATAGDGQTTATGQTAAAGQAVTATGGAHPIIASAEPGERWRYCFADDEVLE